MVGFSHPVAGGELRSHAEFCYQYGKDIEKMWGRSQQWSAWTAVVKQFAKWMNVAHLVIWLYLIYPSKTAAFHSYLKGSYICFMPTLQVSYNTLCNTVYIYIYTHMLYTIKHVCFILTRYDQDCTLISTFSSMNSWLKIVSWDYIFCHTTHTHTWRSRTSWKQLIDKTW